jgi:predicted membrane protein
MSIFDKALIAGHTFLNSSLINIETTLDKWNTQDSKKMETAAEVVVSFALPIFFASTGGVLFPFIAFVAGGVLNFNADAFYKQRKITEEKPVNEINEKEKPVEVKKEPNPNEVKIANFQETMSKIADFFDKYKIAFYIVATAIAAFLPLYVIAVPLAVRAGYLCCSYFTNPPKLVLNEPKKDEAKKVDNKNDEKKEIDDLNDKDPNDVVKNEIKDPNDNNNNNNNADDNI